MGLELEAVGLAPLKRIEVRWEVDIETETEMGAKESKHSIKVTYAHSCPACRRTCVTLLAHDSDILAGHITRASSLIGSSGADHCSQLEC